MPRFTELLDNYLQAKAVVDNLKKENPNVECFSACFHGQVTAFTEAREALDEAYDNVVARLELTVSQVNSMKENPNA